MAEEKLQVIGLNDDFYRDGFYKALFALGAIIVAIALLAMISMFMFFDKPAPVAFAADDEWRILPAVPVDQAYISDADLMQWVSEVLPAAFTYDFVNYSKQLQNLNKYFTPNGWQKFSNQVNVYANADKLLNAKQFIDTDPQGAPFVLTKGLLDGKYSWWVQMPLTINYITAEQSSTQPVTARILIVRVPTLDNLSGVAIENIIVAKGGGDQIRLNG